MKTIDYERLSTRFDYRGGKPLKELYEDALSELIDAGHARPSYDPLGEGTHLIRFMFLGESFVLYRLSDEHVHIDFIHVPLKDRGKGVSLLLKDELESLVKSRASWPKVIRADIVKHNEASLAAFKDYNTRSIIVEKHIKHEPRTKGSHR